MICQTFPKVLITFVSQEKYMQQSSPESANCLSGWTILQQQIYSQAQAVSALTMRVRVQIVFEDNLILGVPIAYVVLLAVVNTSVLIVQAACLQKNDYDADSPQTHIIINYESHQRPFSLITPSSSASTKTICTSPYPAFTFAYVPYNYFLCRKALALLFDKNSILSRLTFVKNFSFFWRKKQIMYFSSSWSIFCITKHYRLNCVNYSLLFRQILSPSFIFFLLNNQLTSLKVEKLYHSSIASIKYQKNVKKSVVYHPYLASQDVKRKGFFKHHELFFCLSLESNQIKFICFLVIFMKA